MATTLVLSQPTLDVLLRVFCFSFLGVIRSTNYDAGGPTFANHWPHSQILCLAYFRLFNGCGAKQTRSHKVGIKPKWHGVKQRQLI